jgi:hypothetical protein
MTRNSVLYTRHYHYYGNEIEDSRLAGICGIDGETRNAYTNLIGKPLAK